MHIELMFNEQKRIKNVALLDIFFAKCRLFKLFWGKIFIFTLVLFIRCGARNSKSTCN